MRQIVQRKMRGVFRLLLPRERAIRASAAKHAPAIVLLHDLDLQHRSPLIARPSVS